MLRLTMLFHDFGKPQAKTTDEKGIDHFHGHPAISEELAGKILRRLKFDNETIRQVKKLVSCHDDHPARTPAGVRRAVNRIGTDLFPLYLKVQRADIMAQNPATREEKLTRLYVVTELYEQILKEKDCVILKQLAVTGRDLMMEGIPAGPGLGDVLVALLDLVIEDPKRNEKTWLLTKAKEIYEASRE